LKAEINNESLTINIPDKRIMLDPFISETDNERNFNKQMLNINDDHYKKNYSSVDSSSMSNTRDGNKFATVSSSYKNDTRFASISSEPIQPFEEVQPETNSSRLYSFLGVAYQTSAYVAGAVRDRVSTMDLGTKLQYTGGKTVEVLKYTGSKVYEKSSELYVFFY
jgi:hypothetical protein